MSNPNKFNKKVIAPILLAAVMAGAAFAGCDAKPAAAQPPAKIESPAPDDQGDAVPIGEGTAPVEQTAETEEEALPIEPAPDAAETEQPPSVDQDDQWGNWFGDERDEYVKKAIELEMDRESTFLPGSKEFRRAELTDINENWAMLFFKAKDKDGIEVRWYIAYDVNGGPTFIESWVDAYS
jgi:hypothetical protein